MNRRKEIATFTCRVTAWEAIVHLSFACCHSLPVKLSGIRLAKRLNTTQIILPALSSSLLAYYAWARKYMRFVRGDLRRSRKERAGR